MQLTVTASFNIVPGKEAEAEAAITKLVDAVRESEPGTLIYAWHRLGKDPSRILVFEVYEDDAAIEAHRATPHQAEFQKHFAPGTGLFDPASVKLERWDRFQAVVR
jgi:quinol monooxygenase YgiN